MATATARAWTMPSTMAARSSSASAASSDPFNDHAPMTIRYHRRRLLKTGAAALGSALLPVSATVHAAASHRFAIGPRDFLLDGKPLQIRCGEMHFARVPREYWTHRLK